MRQVKLLKSWKGHIQGDIITIDNNVAFGLVDSKVATYDLIHTKEMRVDKKVGRYKTK